MIKRGFAHELRDVHAPGRLDDGGVHWQMARGADAVDVSVSAAALQRLAEDSEQDLLALFEAHRAYLCSLAAVKAATHGSGPLRLEDSDLPAP